MGQGYAARAWTDLVRLSSTLRPTCQRGRTVNMIGAYTEASDEELARWSANGDRRAFDEIVVRHGPVTLRLALRMIDDRLAAEDAAQDALVKIWNQIDRFDPKIARFRTWLYRIVVNLCIDYQRRARPDPMPEGYDPIDPAAGAEEMMEVQERDAALMTALKELPARQQAAMMLVYNEGVSGAEAARILGLSAKAVERLLARARTYLRARLQPEIY